MLRTLRVPVVLAAAAFAGVALPPLLGRPAAEALADQVDDDIALLKTYVKSKDTKAIVKKLTDLEGKNDARYAEECADIARNGVLEDQARKQAMKMAAHRKHAELFKWLKGRLDDKKMMEDRPELYLAVLDSLGSYSDKAVAEDLADVVKKNLANKPEITKRAIAAYGSIRENSIVTQLVAWLEQTEKTGASGGTGGGSGGGGKSMSTETKANYGIARVAVLKALKNLTQEDIEDAASWQKWWKDNEKTFKFPDPNAPDIDYSTLTEYADKAYGFTIKKPVGKFWAFKKNEDAGGRLLIDYRDDSGLEWARARVFTWKPNKEITNVEQFGKYFETLFREKEFEPKFATGGDPKIEVKKIGGREMTVASARGMGKDAIKAWESCERRVYITMAAPALFLYIECTMRAGAEDAVKQSLWDALEGMTFKK